MTMAKKSARKRENEVNPIAAKITKREKIKSRLPKRKNSSR
jgi:hypothetical protein